MSRRQGLPWRTFIQLAWTPFPSLKLAAACECRSGDLRLAAGVRIARWRIDERLRFHPRLGFSHSIFLSYVY
jgi:hypothetical protein